MRNAFIVIYNLDTSKAEKAAKLIDKKFVGLRAWANSRNVNVQLTASDWTREQGAALAYYAQGVQDALEER